MAKIKQLNDIEDGNYTPPISKKSQSPKKSQTQKQSQSPKKSPAASKVDSPKKNNGSSGNGIPVKRASQIGGDKRSSDVSSNITKTSIDYDEPKMVDKPKQTTPEKKVQTGTSGKEKAQPSSNIEPANKKTKTASKSQDSEDIDDFENFAKQKGKNKAKASDAADKKTKPKAETKPADVKTKSIASYFMAKPKTT